MADSDDDDFGCRCIPGPVQPDRSHWTGDRTEDQLVAAAHRTLPVDPTAPIPFDCYQMPLDRPVDCTKRESVDSDSNCDHERPNCPCVGAGIRMAAEAVRNPNFHSATKKPFASFHHSQWSVRTILEAAGSQE